MPPAIQATAVLGLGAGGHAKVVIEILRAAGGFDVVGLLDPRAELHGTELLGVPVLGDDVLLAAHEARAVFIGLGGTRDLRPRQRLFEWALAEGRSVAAAVHPTAIVSGSASIGDGPTIAPAAVVNAGARIGDDVIVNTGAIIEHDCIIGNHVHVATGALLAGGVLVGNGTHVGAGATVIEGIRIGAGSVVGAGAVVVSDVEDGVVVAGVPARVLRRTDP